MQIQVRTLSGGASKFDVEVSDKLIYLKKLIQEKIGVTIPQQRLVMNGKILPDDSSMNDVGLKSGDIIQLILQLKGGSL